ncbi:imm11 family protein [Paenibacillus koleovorans]|uniref:imm11 family protein n=1 Tax=Paenibacillus koleovorans TaxID=121608 RepID=UPI000FD7FB83|nr:DUF1629 domain-containing protein [Paenibacillus koleovorans]
MKVWILSGTIDIGNEILNYDNVQQGLDIIKFIGRSRVSIQKSWNAVSINSIEKGEKLDFHKELRVPILSKDAVQVIQELIKDMAEILPLIHPDREYFVLNILNIIDCIDESKIQFTSYPTGTIKAYTKWEFKKEMVAGQHIFKATYHTVRDVPVDIIFVSDEFVEKVEKSKLKGFYFTEVWNG